MSDENKKVGTGISVPRVILNIIAEFAAEQLIDNRSAAISSMVLEWQKMKVLLEEVGGDRQVTDRPALLAQLLAEWRAAQLKN